jgi:hypothetical protein
MNLNRRTSLAAITAGSVLQVLPSLGSAQTYPARASRPHRGAVSPRRADRYRSARYRAKARRAPASAVRDREQTRCRRQYSDAEAVAKAPADGYTLLLGTTAHAINPSLFKSLAYDIQKDLVPVVAADQPAAAWPWHLSNARCSSIADLIALARSPRPAGSMPYGSVRQWAVDPPGG